MRRINRKHYETTKILLQTSRVIGASLDFNKVVDLVLNESRKALNVDHASLFLIDPASGMLMPTKAMGFSEDQMDNIKILGGWEVVNDQVLKKKKPLIVNDIRRNPIFKHKRLPISREAFPINSFLAVPLKKEKTHEVIGVLIVSNSHRARYGFTADDEELLVALSNYVSIALLNAKLYETLKNLFISTVMSLVKAVDAKDRYTSGHSERVMKYSMAIGKAMKLGDDEIENLRLSSILHDVGKIGINDAILTKPFGLEPSERKLIRRHPLIGAEIVESIDNSHKIIDGIAQHHEWFNGKGYPRGLERDQISLQGRIISVADTFDALTTKRPYQKPFSAKEAFFEIRKSANTQFDPAVIKAFSTSFSRNITIWDGSS